MGRKKVIKGGDASTIVKPFPWIALLLFVMGVVVGIGGVWFVMKGKELGTSTTVVVVPQATATAPPSSSNSRLPVYPEKDPEYPLRVMSQTAEYQQLGILKSMDGSEPIALPLFGRRLPNRPDRWEYYTATDKQNMLRVPIEYESRDCLEEVGCNELYKGDTVVVPVYGKNYEVQLYKYRP